MSGGGHGPAGAEGGSANKKVALLISVLALFLAFAETLAKSAQTEAIGANIEASNLWAFFQAKTIRQTVVRTAGEAVGLTPPADAPDAVATRSRQLEAWLATAARWETEPSTGEGRKELSARAKDAADRAERQLNRYHNFEIGSAAFQIAIVLASAMLITGVAALAWGGVALGAFGLAMVIIGLFVPGLHLL